MKNLNESRKRDQDVVPFERPGEKTGGGMVEEDVSPSRSSLITTRQVEELRERWTAIQSRFVDEPRKSVQEADQLVQSAIQQIEEVFASERSNLEKQWSRGDQASTEDLRICLQHYRQFFDKLLSRV